MLRMSDLAAQTTLTSSGITRVVDRLVERGLATRRSCATDRRTTYAVITDAGRSLLDEVLPGQLELIDAWLVAPLRTAGDQVVAEFEAALRAVRDHAAPCAVAGADGAGLAGPGGHVPAQAAAPS
jgi:DNA-binding MarR family transcriptional regulator